MQLSAAWNIPAVRPRNELYRICMCYRIRARARFNSHSTTDNLPRRKRGAGGRKKNEKEEKEREKHATPVCFRALAFARNGPKWEEEGGGHNLVIIIAVEPACPINRIARPKAEITKITNTKKWDSDQISCRAGLEIIDRNHDSRRLKINGNPAARHGSAAV